MRFLKDGTERVVVLAAKPTDKDAITLTEIAAGTDLSGSIVKPLTVNFSDSESFNFATINVEGNGQAPGRTNAAGTIRIVREYDQSTKKPDPAKDAAFTAVATKGTVLPLFVYRGPKTYNEALAVGDEYDYFEFITDTPRVVEDDNTYIAYDVPLIFAGGSSAQSKIASGS